MKNYARGTRCHTYRHGLFGTKIHHCWDHMIQRCTNKNHPSYADYGERGIKVCEEWRNSVEAFAKWAFANGYDESLTLDRRDNNGNYEPANCRFVDRKTQTRNRRNTRYLTAFGETKPLSEWCEDSRCTVTLAALRRRLDNYGWSPELALTTPRQQRPFKPCV